MEIIDSGLKSPQELMDKDATLLAQLSDSSQPILHFYEWDRDCLSYGYFIHPSDHLDLSALQAYQIEMVRRPTGGGIIFHLTDFAFSVLIPSCHPRFSLNTLENYAWVNNLVLQAIAPLLHSLESPSLHKNEASGISQSNCSFCMGRPTQFDIVIQNKKIGGAAQRRTRQGLLHQGTLSLAFPDRNMLRDVLKGNSSLLAAMQDTTYTFLKNPWKKEDLIDLKNEVKRHLQTMVLF